MEAEHAAALSRDREALAAAISANQPEPKDTKVGKLATQVEDEARRPEALELALTRAEDELLWLVQQHRDTWLADLEQQLETSRADYAASVDALVESRARLQVPIGLKDWLTRYPHVKSLKTEILSVSVPGLQAPNGERYTFHDVAAALHADASPLDERGLYVVETGDDW